MTNEHDQPNGDDDIPIREILVEPGMLIGIRGRADMDGIIYEMEHGPEDNAELLVLKAPGANVEFEITVRLKDGGSGNRRRVPTLSLLRKWLTGQPT
jgi:hypothetical protein